MSPKARLEFNVGDIHVEQGARASFAARVVRYAVQCNLVVDWVFSFRSDQSEMSDASVGLSHVYFDQPESASFHVDANPVLINTSEASGWQWINGSAVHADDDYVLVATNCTEEMRHGEQLYRLVGDDAEVCSLESVLICYKFTTHKFT